MFHYFPKLPIELRLKIWNTHLNASRNVEIKIRLDETGLRLESDLPVLLKVSSESRSEGLKRYTQLFKAGNQIKDDIPDKWQLTSVGINYFNPERDTFVVSGIFVSLIQNVIPFTSPCIQHIRFTDITLASFDYIIRNCLNGEGIYAALKHVDIILVDETTLCHTRMDRIIEQYNRVEDNVNDWEGLDTFVIRCYSRIVLERIGRKCWRKYEQYGHGHSFSLLYQ